MIRLLPILLSLTGCGLADRMVKRDMLPPGDRIDVSPGAMAADGICMWINPPLCNQICVDINQDGGIDGDDVYAFVCEWNDTNRLDIDGDGCSDIDNDGDGVCDYCDLWRFLVIWEMGG